MDNSYAYDEGEWISFSDAGFDFGTEFNQDDIILLDVMVELSIALFLLLRRFA